jgi:hypothetical protein
MSARANQMARANTSLKFVQIVNPMKRAIWIMFASASLMACGAGQSDKELDDRERELIRREAKLQAQEELNAQQSESEENATNQDQGSSHQEPAARETEPRYSNDRNYYAYGAGRYPYTSDRLVNYSDVRGMSKWDLTIMRNEIFARHGYIFHKNEDMVAYFNAQSWYRPVSTDVHSQLSEIEKANIHFIKAIEEQR